MGNVYTGYHYQQSADQMRLKGGTFGCCFLSEVNVIKVGVENDVRGISVGQSSISLPSELLKTANQTTGTFCTHKLLALMK